MISQDVDNAVHHIIPPYHSNPPFLSKAAFGVSDGSSASSSRSSPRSDSFDSGQNLSNGFNTSFDPMELDSDLHNIFPNGLDPYMEDPFKFSSCLPRVQSDPDASPWSEFNQACSAYGAGEPYVYSQPLQGVNNMTNLAPTSFSKTSYSRQPSCSYPSVNLTSPTSTSSASVNPTTEELNQYRMWLLFQPGLLVNDSSVPVFH